MTDQLELNCLDDETLKQVIERFDVEQQFLLMRVCRRFSRLVFDKQTNSGTLTKVTSIRGITILLLKGNRYVLKALKKLPNLLSIRRHHESFQNYGLEDELLEQIARSNPKINNFEDWTDNTIIKFVKFVKRTNDDYDESKIRQLIGCESPVEDLKFKLVWDCLFSENLSESKYERVHFVAMRFFIHAIFPRNFDQVKQVELYKIDNLGNNNCQLLRNVVSNFPALQILSITESEKSPKIARQHIFESLQDISLLSNFSLKTPDSMHLELVAPKWNGDDFQAFERLLGKQNLVNITLEGLQDESEPRVIRSIIEYPNKYYKSVKINEALCYDHFGTITIKGYPQHSLVIICNKFKKVELIRLVLKRKVSSRAGGVENAVRECQQISNNHQNRRLRLQIESARSIDYTYDL